MSTAEYPRPQELADSGTTAVEYAALAGMVGITLIAGATALGTGIDDAFREFAAFSESIFDSALAVLQGL